MKIVRAGRSPSAATPASRTSGSAAEARFGAVARRGEVRPTDIWDGFVAKVLSFVDRGAIRPLKVVVDAANGMAGTMLPPVLDRLPQLDVVRCFFEPDGVLPEPRAEPAAAREPRPSSSSGPAPRAPTSGSPTTATPTAASSSTTPASSFPGDFVTALLARAMLEQGAGRDGSSTTCGRAGRCRARSRRPGASPSSTASVTRSSRSACARSTRCSPARSPRTTTSATSPGRTRGSCPFLVMLELLSRSGRKLSELLAPFRERLLPERGDQHAGRGRRRQAPRDRGALRGRGGRISHLDGVSVDFDDWHFNVRPSNTEPLLRLNLEALDEPEMERRRDEVLDLIRS